MSAIEATFRGHMPLTQVGDEMTISARCRIVGIEEDLIDVTATGGATEVVAGERHYKLLLTNAVFNEAPSSLHVGWIVRDKEQLWAAIGSRSDELMQQVANAQRVILEIERVDDGGLHVVVRDIKLDSEMGES